jgi:hypothetical protein
VKREPASEFPEADEGFPDTWFICGFFYEYGCTHISYSADETRVLTSGNRGSLLVWDNTPGDGDMRLAQHFGEFAELLPRSGGYIQLKGRSVVLWSSNLLDGVRAVLVPNGSAEHGGPDRSVFEGFFDQGAELAIETLTTPYGGSTHDIGLRNSRSSTFIACAGGFSMFGTSHMHQSVEMWAVK